MKARPSRCRGRANRPAEGGHIPANTVAAIGKRLGEILLGAQKLDAPFAHRDISLRNIIIRTTRRSLAQQIAHCSFDLCLVDLGSSSIKRSDPSFTMSTGIWRNGTPSSPHPRCSPTTSPSWRRFERRPASIHTSSVACSTRSMPVTRHIA
ncbi:MAG: hypothetical protein ACLU0O_11445 [Collinsella sp.]